MSSMLFGASFQEAFQTLSQRLGVFMYYALLVPSPCPHIKKKKRVQQVWKAKNYASGYRARQLGFL